MVLKILAMPVDSGGCGMYRVRQPLKMVAKHTPHDTHVVDKDKDDMIQVAISMSMVDIIVCRPGANIPEAKVQLTQSLKEISKEIGKKLELKAKWVMDLDDNTEIISPYNYHFSEYGMYEYYDEANKVQLWKDGESGFDLKRNKKRMSDLIESIKDADLITVATPKLVDYAQKYNQTVAVLPNCVDLDYWWHIPNTTGKPRLGWSGGISHYDDFYSIKKPLNNFLDSSDYTIHLAGNGFPGILTEGNKKKLKEYPWVPFEGHSYRMMAMQLDVAFIPLADLPFNHYKSCIKWYEMSAMGIPSVVANVQPYSTEIEDGVTGLLYSSQGECLEKLNWVKSAPLKAAKIGLNARKWVEQNRDARKMAYLWETAYKGILE